jgi:hypothetical protein
MQRSLLCYGGERITLAPTYNLLLLCCDSDDLRANVIPRALRQTGTKVRMNDKFSARNLLVDK